jgi:hypothetical protein
MPMMKSPFDQTVSSLTGHCIAFVTGEATFVPDKLVPECLARGIMHTGEPAPQVVAPEEKSDNEADPEDGFDAALNAALIKIITREDPTDLKSDLTPKVSRVVAEMSPDLRRPTATEISDAYMALQENIDLAE